MNEHTDKKLADILEKSESAASKYFSGRRRLMIIAGSALAIGLIIWAATRSKNGYEFISKEVTRGSFTVIVSATGQLQPVNQVDVGTEVSGTIEKIEADHNQLVSVGEVLARLDTDRYEAQVLQSEAAVESAKARLAEAQASVMEADNKLDRLRTVHKMSGGSVPSINELEAAEAILKRARASELSARAAIAESNARLNIDNTNLEKAIIRSPIDGIVLNRLIEPGQTVAASLQAPVLFTLAESLTKMELHIDVDEADIGAVEKGQEATFSVDAYPNRKFPAAVTEVRFAPQTVAGVVTYRVILDVSNAERLLRPGMTATADIVVKNVVDALLVSNSALRFSPPKEDEEKKEKKGSLFGNMFRRRPPRMSAADRKEKSAEPEQKVWTLRDGVPVSIPIVIGATDDEVTEVISGEVTPGDELLIDARRKKDD